MICVICGNEIGSEEPTVIENIAFGVPIGIGKARNLTGITAVNLNMCGSCTDKILMGISRSRTHAAMLRSQAIAAEKERLVKEVEEEARKTEFD